VKTSTRHKEFMREARSLSERHQLWRLFADFVTMSAISLHNGVLRNEEREQEFLRIEDRYNVEERRGIAKLLAITTLALEEDHACDFLGEVFQQLELGNHWKGQFFTPFEVSRLLAAMVMPDADDPLFITPGFIRLGEPACGAGGMVLAAADVLRSRGINYQQCMHVVATDVDETAAMMTYVQLALRHIPAIVVHGNTLSLETTSTWATPAHVLGFWSHKLRRADRLLEPPPVIALPPGQLALFSTNSNVLDSQQRKADV
jgi:type I restriction-modification system DNA methylase subunit